MEPSYSVVAAALSKFHTAPEGIQALWLLAGAATWLGSLVCLLRAATKIAALAVRRGKALGEPLHAIYRAPDGKLMLYVLGQVRELEPAICPP
jgi:hypothetical protein